MAYVCELGTEQRIYVENQGTQTIVTAASGSPGQQQQASCGFQTGAWTVPPQLFQAPFGAVLKVTSAQGDYFIQIQGGSMGVMGGAPAVRSFQQMSMQQVAHAPASSMPTMQPMPPMQPMTPMPPMPPMTMGNMQMSTNPMELRMGNMEMRMGTPTTASASPSGGDRRFCSQCGSPVKSEDRFCSSCGHRLEM